MASVADQLTTSRLRRFRARFDSEGTAGFLNCCLFPLRVMKTKATVLPSWAALGDDITAPTIAAAEDETLAAARALPNLLPSASPRLFIACDPSAEPNFQRRWNDLIKSKQVVNARACLPPLHCTPTYIHWAHHLYWASKWSHHGVGASKAQDRSSIIWVCVFLLSSNR